MRRPLPAAGPSLVVRREDMVLARLHPGGVYRIGRHAANDIVLACDTVSSFHVRITWAADQPTPVLRDEGSQNGTYLDGVRLAPATTLPLAGGTLRLGELELDLELRSALLDTTEERVQLFSDDGPELQGSLRGPLDGLLLELEVAKRSGTLSLELPEGAQVTFFMGRVMGASAGPARGREAFRAALEAPPGTRFRFAREFEPQSEPLAMWPSDLLRALRGA